MSDFDRDALVARTKSQSGGRVFWVAVAALPVLGVAAGLALAVVPRGAPAMQTVQTSQPVPAAEVETAEPATPEPAAHAGFSAHAELDRYRLTLSTLSTCGGGGYSPDEHYTKASRTYLKLNRAAHEQLAAMAMNEPDPNAIEPANIPQTRLGVMAGAVTGSLQREAIKQVEAFEKGFERADRLSTGYLGESPSAAECLAFRNEVIMGKHNLRLP